VKQAVMAGLGCSIMPLIGVKNELNNGSLQIVPVKGLPIKSNWNLIWLKGKSFRLSQLLIWILSQKERIIGTSLNGLRIRIEVVQNKYALLFVLALY
jgi:DNA-binding transcriptional LysR family regulator